MCYEERHLLPFRLRVKLLGAIILQLHEFVEKKNAAEVNRRHGRFDACVSFPLLFAGFDGCDFEHRRLEVLFVFV